MAGRYETIVVGVDGSEEGARALRSAARLARAYRATLVLAHGAREDTEGKRLLDDAATEVEALGVKNHELELRQGPGATILADTAAERDADLIVVGSRGLSGAKRMFMGSVSHGIAHQAPCDVLIVRRGCSTEGAPYAGILIGTDGSATADRCARAGYDLARRLKATLTLVFAGHPQTGDAVLRDTHEGYEQILNEDSAQPVLLDVRFRVIRDEPSAAILDVAEEHGCDLIVVGNKGLTGTSRFKLGSVPQRVMTHATGDVLVVHTSTDSLGDLAPGTGGIVSVDGRKVAVFKDDAGHVQAVLAKCTHMGCIVEWNGGERTWDCPCHGSRFAPDGAVVNGPAARPLPAVTI